MERFFRKHWLALVGTLWFSIQGVLIATGGQRPDGAFAFRMFPDSSTIQVRLFRTLRSGARVWIPAGAYTHGHGERCDVRAGITDPSFARLDNVVHASYGGRAQIARLGALLADFSRRCSDSAVTTFEFEIVWRHNGRPPQTVVLREPQHG